MAYDKEALSAMSGEKTFKKPKPLVLNQISIDGTTGKFKKTIFLKPKDSVTGKYEEVDLGLSVDVVFLKIRRKLVEFSNTKGMVRSTSEHSVPSDTVMMFGDNSRKGVAKDLREAFPMLRTQQIIYAIEKASGEVVRLIIKGASLGSETKDKATPGFYDYLKNFEGNEHMYEFLTTLTSISEKSKLGSYYCMTFVKGQQLTDEQMEKVAAAIKSVHDAINEFDAFYATKTEKEIPATKASGDEVEEVETVEYPDDINPDDIPF